MPFKNGFYLLSSFNKLVGAHDGGRTVIVHPFGTPYQAQKHLEHIDGEEYLLTFNGKLAGNVNGSVELVALEPTSSNLQFRWKIVPVKGVSYAPVYDSQILVADSKLCEGWSVKYPSGEVKISQEKSLIAVAGPISDE